MLIIPLTYGAFGYILARALWGYLKPNAWRNSDIPLSLTVGMLLGYTLCAYGPIFDLSAALVGFLASWCLHFLVWHFRTPS